MNPSPIPRVRIVLGFLAIYLVWGSTYLAIRYAIETLPPLLLAGRPLVNAGRPALPLGGGGGARPDRRRPRRRAGPRDVTAGAALCAWGRRDGARPTSRHWRAALILGAFFFLGGN